MSTTPPSKGAKAATAPAKKVAATDGEAKTRAPRKDYGFSPEAVIAIVADKEIKFRGQRLDWHEKVKAFNGKTAGEFLEKNKGKDSPRGWLRFFAAEGYVTLTAPKVTKAA
jgi:hypothetical protein